MRSFFLLLIMSASICAQGQIQIGSAEGMTMNRSGKLSEDDVAELKKTTTLFTIQKADAVRMADFEKAIASVWTITPFKIILPDEQAHYANLRGYSIFSFGFYDVSGMKIQDTNPYSVHIVYELWLPQFNKKGRPTDRHLLARFAISADANTLWESHKILDVNGEVTAQPKMQDLLSNKAKFNNWGPGFCKGSFKSVNDHLLAVDRQGIFTEFTNKEALQQLKTDTLYLPDYVNKIYIAWADERLKKETFIVPPDLSKVKYERDEEDKEEIIGGYPYPLKYVNDEELNRMIVHSTKPFHYLIFTHSTPDKYISVFEGVSGRLLYTRYVHAGHNFKKKDLIKLARTID